MVVIPSARVLIPPYREVFPKRKVGNLMCNSYGGEGGIILLGKVPNTLHIKASLWGFCAIAHGGQTLCSGSHPSERTEVANVFGS